MSETISIHLSELPSSIRKTLIFFLLTLTAAYCLGLGYVYYNTGMNYVGITEEFRGSEIRMEFEKPVGEMFQTVHNHMFGLSLTFLISGIIFYFSSINSGFLKTFIMTEPFLSIVLSFGSFWLIRFHSPAWGWLLIGSSILMGLCFVVQITVALYDLIIRATASKSRFV